METPIFYTLNGDIQIESQDRRKQRQMFCNSRTPQQRESARAAASA
jgi:hypothetical protein